MKSITVFILSVVALPAQSAIVGLVKDIYGHTTNTTEIVATDVIDGKSFEKRFFFPAKQRLLLINFLFQVWLKCPALYRKICQVYQVCGTN